MRCYSSDTPKHPEVRPQKPTEDASATDAPPTSSFADAFGFQSLRGLFYEPQPSNRYSRAREAEPSERAPLGSDATRTGSPNGTWDPQSQDMPSLTDFTSSKVSSEPPASDEPLSFDLNQPPAPVSAAGDQQPSSQSQQNTTEHTGIEPNFRRHMMKSSNDISNPKDRKDSPLTFVRSGPREDKHSNGVPSQKPLRNRAAGGDHGGRSDMPQSLSQGGKGHLSWGLSQEDSATLDTFADPDSNVRKVARRDSSPKIRDEKPSSRASSQEVGHVKQSPWNSSEEVAHERSPQEQTLTHVNASGEAHMVDVGAKSATKRTAIACSCVTFSNLEPFRLIFENANKKGDVLGVARVAGIMGAKRTSDLIPLCHPINISKVNVDVKLLAPRSSVAATGYISDQHGAVEIEAHVECVGATGVEMEALTAATVAATTVFDMCKAVDRDACIAGSRVVYKSGGKSGTHCFRPWAKQRGSEFFTERGLVIPFLVEQVENNKTQRKERNSNRR